MLKLRDDARAFIVQTVMEEHPELQEALADQATKHVKTYIRM